MTEVAWLTSSYPWAGDTVGGIFFRAQAQALARAGLAVAVMAPVPAVPWPLGHLSRKWRAHALAPRLERDGEIEVLRPRYPNVPGQPSWAMPDRFISDAAWRTRGRWPGARLIHGHYSLLGLAARRLARRARLPYVLTFHGSDINTWPDLHPERLGDLRTAVREAAAVFAVSGALADRVHLLTGVAPIHLPIGSDHRAIAAATLPRPEARRVLGLADDRIIVLFVGRLILEKGVRELVAAVLGLGDPFTAVLVGAGPEAGYGMDDPRARDRLVYAGARRHDDVVKFMAAADVLVLPSYGEGLPTVLVEAGSIGLPVVASAVGGIPELLADDRGTVLPEVSTAAVGQALSEFAAARNRAAEAATRLQAHVHARYDVDVNAARLVDHYREIDAAIGATPPCSDG
jgi:teichuronic acid biosynthesis glycosyltransferase TuaC